MQEKVIENDKKGIYKIGLDREQEAVISAHFMHNINQNHNFNLYSQEEFSRISLPINSRLIFEDLIPSLLNASNNFIKERAVAAKIRAKENYRKYRLASPASVGFIETITEVMFDRQFLKGSKENYSCMSLWSRVKTCIENDKPIKMVIPALPYKFSSPLKTRGTLPDFSEVNFLLSLAEIAKTIDHIYREKKPDSHEKLATFTVICDGRRFNTFLNEPDDMIKYYQSCLEEWIKKLDIEEFINIVDYQEIISKNLPDSLQKEKNLIREKVFEDYNRIFIPLLNPNDMKYTIRKTIELEPDPEQSNIEGRFIPLFKSLIYIIKYKILTNYTLTHKKDYKKLYRELTRHILEPYVELTEDDQNIISNFIQNLDAQNIPTEQQLFEYLRRLMLCEVWDATIKYMAEIKSDRDLLQEPIITCLPDHFRWTIHAKAGQLAILTTTASGDPVQAWCGVGVFKLSKNNKIKLYTLPTLSLEGVSAIPITVINEGESMMALKSLTIQNQPIFYVYPDIKFENINDLIEKIRKGLTRKRKF